jgi:hypothetical protein
MWQQGDALGQERERRAGGVARSGWSERHRRQALAERLDGAKHQADRHVGQRLPLCMGLTCICKEAGEREQQDLIGHVEQVRNLRSHRVVDDRDIGTSARADGAGAGGSRRFKRRINQA